MHATIESVGRLTNVFLGLGLLLIVFLWEPGGIVGWAAYSIALILLIVAVIRHFREGGPGEPR